MMLLTRKCLEWSRVYLIVGGAAGRCQSSSYNIGNQLISGRCIYNFNGIRNGPIRGYSRVFENTRKVQKNQWSQFAGGRRLKSTELPRIKSGSASSVVPKSLGKQKPSSWDELKRLFQLARKEKRAILAAIGCLVVSSSITMCVPYSIGRIMDIITTENMSGQKIMDFCLILFGLFLIGAVANFGRIYLINGAALRIVTDLRSKLYRKMLNQESGWFDTKGTGELVNRLSNDTLLVGNSLSQNLSNGLRSTVTILVGTSMMLYTSPHLTFISLAIVPPIAGLAIIYGRYIKIITKRLLDQYAEIMKIGEERLNNIKTVKMFCKEEHENKIFQHELIGALNIGYKEVLARASFYGLTGLTGNIITISVLYYGGTLVTNGQITLGSLTSFIMYAGYIALSIGGLSNFYSEINKGIGAATRVWEIFDRPIVIPTHGGLIPLTKPKGEIIFNDVGFSFPTRPDSQVINGMNFTIKPGTVTAIVGRSGSGKTTVASLLLRLYDPQYGGIYLDGNNLKDLNPSWLRSHIGAVNQEPILFSGSIRENILYGLNNNGDDDQNISENDFMRIVRQAHVDDFARKLPNGFDTVVGQRGMLLSGGQKQRVAIARALIKNPSIMVLDEATSALDSLSESLVQKALANLSQGRTVLTIAHRLSTIRNAELILVIDGGRIAEQGSYEELMAKENGVFKELVKNQTFDCRPVQVDQANG